MITPDFPSNEQQRLLKLKSLNILDTNAEERFDRITRLAQKMFNVPIALVSLIDENRQWFKSCIGVGVNETSRETSFCGHTILDNKMMVIPAASEDVRFFDNPMVLGEPYVEFYAGCPIMINGYQLGTLCIADHKRRQFDEDDQAALKDLTRTVELELSALQLALHDQLTGVLNRRGFLSAATNVLNLSKRSKFPVTLIYLDLNNFKVINDNFGHQVGDNILECFAEHLSNFFRASDVIGRLGGDEFVVLLSNTTKQAMAKTMDKLQSSWQGYCQEKRIEINVSFASGVIGYDEAEHPTIEALLSDTDKNMYECKYNDENE